jgi:predicted 3-demethylubiquinone-9 3-methyltransferase (glyoxalase superfamily)
MAITQRLTTCLWFDHQAEEAANYYVSIFKNARIIDVARYSDAGQEIHGRPPGSVMTVSFELDGMSFMGLNGGPHFTFNEAVSIVINCDTQDEIDYYWEKLAAGGDPKAQVCGWLKDRYGLSWQVSPRGMEEMLRDPESPGAKRAFNAMLTMAKMDIAALEKAYRGE